MNEFEIKEAERNRKKIEWLEYFRNDKNPALHFIDDMENALRTNWIDGVDAELCLQMLQARIQEISPLVNRKLRQQNPTIEEMNNEPN